MTQEEKAQAYDEAIERAKKVHKYSSDLAEIKRMEEIFPELKESEDEKIMKALIEYFNEQCDMSDWNGVYGYQVVNWLEKVSKDNKFLKSIKIGDILTKSPDGILINLGQSDRALEHSDKIEPKFKVGDWITNGACIIKITSIDDRYYWHDNDCVGGDIESINKEYHLWNIQDAKEGDILANDKVICVYKERVSEHVIKVSINYSRKEDIETHYEVIGDFNLYPATKEERDFFFSKLKSEIGV